MMKSHWKKKQREKRKHRWEYNPNATPPIKHIVKSFAELKEQLDLQDDSPEEIARVMNACQGSLMK